MADKRGSRQWSLLSSRPEHGEICTQPQAQCLAGWAFQRHHIALGTYDKESEKGPEEAYKDKVLLYRYFLSTYCTAHHWQTGDKPAFEEYYCKNESVRTHQQPTHSNHDLGAVQCWNSWKIHNSEKNKHTHRISRTTTKETRLQLILQMKATLYINKQQ